jgi:hypothetical protein
MGLMCWLAHRFNGRIVDWAELSWTPVETMASSEVSYLPDSKLAAERGAGHGCGVLAGHAARGPGLAHEPGVARLWAQQSVNTRGQGASFLHYSADSGVPLLNLTVLCVMERWLASTFLEFRGVAVVRRQ